MEDKDMHSDQSISSMPGEGRRKLKRMACGRTLDLHGYTVDEGLKELERFLSRAYMDMCRKVLVIHGKGKHSADGAVLRDAVKKYLAASPVAGETGKAGRNDGGDGATWVIIRYRSR